MSDSVSECTQDGILPNKNEAAGLNVRPINSGDAEPIRKLVKQHHSRTTFKDQEFSDRKFSEHLKLILSRPPEMFCPVALLGTRPVGVAWVVVGQYMLTDGPLFATVNLVAVDIALSPVRRAKVFLALMSAVRLWSRQMKATQVFVHVTTGTSLQSTDRLMKASNARFIGGSYVLV